MPDWIEFSYIMLGFAAHIRAITFTPAVFLGVKKYALELFFCTTIALVVLPWYLATEIPHLWPVLIIPGAILMIVMNVATWRVPCGYDIRPVYKRKFGTPMPKTTNDASPIEDDESANR